MSRILILVVAFIVVVKVSDGQEFAGIPVDGYLNEVVSKFTQKGFQLKSDNLSQKPVVSMVGSNLSTKIELFIAYHPTTKEVWRFSVYLAEAKDWKQLKSEYLDHRAILIDKYGQPLSSQSAFKSPYIEGDGNEMEAVTNEKIKFESVWLNKSSISITKWKQVKIDYINPENYKTYKEFVGSQNKENF